MIVNRRGFIKSLGIAVAVAATKYTRKWVPAKRSGIRIVNPLWRDAPYEIRFQQFADEVMIPVFFERAVGPPPLPAGCCYRRDHFPPRFSDNEPYRIPPFIKL